MKKAVYVFAVCLFSYIRSGTPTSFETVWIKDVTKRFQNDERTLIDPDLPNDLTFHLTRGSEILILNLKRNHAINLYVDAYFARPLLMKSPNYEKEDVAYYQDMENWAYMTVRCVKKSNQPCDRIINGNLRIGERTFDVQPVETDVTSRNLVEDPDGLGKQYVLKDQTHMQRGYSVKKKGSTPVNEKNGEHNIKHFRRRFRGQHKQNNLSPLAKSRGLKNVYYVKVAVFIDSSAWDFYVSAFKETNPFTKGRNTRRKIRKMFSHIFNGVNLLYKGIQDNDISINIILSRVSFFEKYTESPHFKSRPVLVNKTYYIDADVYLSDFQKWDDTVGKKLEPGFDHGMLITRYQLFQGDLASAEKDDRYIGGIAATWMVCVIGRRDSVVMIQAWNAMVISVAHEIGHSLGARHDGTFEASHCRAEDQYIMSATMENPNKATTYSRKPWLFSHCSVTSFKNTLKDKKCVTIPGDYYDHNEYTQHVKDEAGEVYNANEQCEFIHGQGSYVCETRTADDCNFMRCFDPQIRICNKKYYVAARGTSCGSNLWCMEGLCLPKRK